MYTAWLRIETTFQKLCTRLVVGVLSVFIISKLDYKIVYAQEVDLSTIINSIIYNNIILCNNTSIHRAPFSTDDIIYCSN